MILISRKEVLKTIMDRKELNIIVDDALNDADLESKDIPTIDLYVDQIINLIAERLKDGSERYHDRQLTKTMINNYSKEGLITPVKGKKYDKEQIVQMLTIYTLKSTLSINEIKRMLHGLYSVEGFDGEELTRLYDRHLEIRQANRAQAVVALDAVIERADLDVENDLDYASLACALAALSAQLKNISQAMIDARFPDVKDEDALNSELGRREQRIERKKERITAKGEARVARAEARVAKVEARTEVKMARVSSRSRVKENDE
jgi:DNA-binding transcriptional MerR regulator